MDYLDIATNGKVKLVFLASLLLFSSSILAETSRDPSFILSDCLGEFITPRLMKEDTSILVDGAFSVCKKETHDYLQSYPESRQEYALKNMREAITWTTNSQKKHAKNKP